MGWLMVIFNQINKKYLSIITKYLHSIILIFLLIVAIVIGNFIFNVLIGKPYIGVIKIDGPITSESKKDAILSAIERAKENSSIKAIVLEINSPGGEASIVEEIYLNLLELRKSKPIVASIDQLGASGAYYIAVASNYIYAKPSSDIGSIGVISVLPEKEPLDENKITTGISKGVGATKKDLASQIQMIQESFLRAVLFQREGKLKISKEELANARVYIGFEALNLGLIDSFGTKFDAIKKASKLARILNYEIAELNEEPLTTITISLSIDESILNSNTNTIPINYYLYLNTEK